MNLNIYIFIGCFLCLSFAVSKEVYASEGLIYGAKTHTRSAFLINKFLQKNFKRNFSDYDVAQSDLNTDGIDEFILRESSCGLQHKMCTHHILAQTNSDIIEIASIHAYNLALGNQYSYGIRNILAYNNPVNDFDYALYVWEPERAQYIISDRK